MKRQTKVIFLMAAIAILGAVYGGTGNLAPQTARAQTSAPESFKAEWAKLITAVTSFQDGKELPHIVTDPTRNTFQHLVATSETLPSTVSADQQLELRMSEKR
jgi:hypothetical protein